MNWLRRRLDRTEDECCGEKLSAYIDRELAPEDRVALERHLAECEDCHWNLETLRQTVEWTRDCASVRVPRVFTIPVEAAAPRPVQARRPAWGLPVLQGATALVALLFVIVAAGDLFVQRTTPWSAPQPVVVQTVAAMEQASTGQEVEATQVVALAQPAATVVVEAVEEVMAPPPSEPTAVALSAVLPTPTPLASEEPLVAEPVPTLAAEVGGMGKQVPALSATVEVTVVAVEPPAVSPRAGATPTMTVTLAITTGACLLAQPLTATATAGPAAYPTATAAPAQQLLSPADSPAVEMLASVPMLAATAVPAAEQETLPTAMADGEYSGAAPTEAPAALPVGPEPTAIAAAPEVRDMGQGAGSDEGQGVVGTPRASVASWLGLAEIVLGAVFVLLVLATAAVMLRRQLR